MAVSDFKIQPNLLNFGEFDVWRVQGNPDMALLSPEELKRYQEIIHPEAARVYGISRCAIRMLVKYYTSQNPNEMLLESLPGGKPVFVNIPDLHLSLSHSGHEVALAFSRSPVGIDIEKSDRRVNPLPIAQRFFTSFEVDLIKQTHEQQTEMFLKLWTAKEAILKLEGTGISGGLERARVVNENEGLIDGKKVFLHQIQWPGLMSQLASFERINSVRVRELLIS